MHKTKSPEETIAYASLFADDLHRGDIVALYGELGSGKTQFVKGICRAFGVTTQPTSPSFIIFNRYNGIYKDKKELLIFHFDLYRIESYNELYDIGFEEYLKDDSICLIEWAEVLNKLLPERRYDIKFTLGEKENERVVNITKVK